MQPERRVLAACAVSLSVLLLGFDAAEKWVGSAECLPTSGCRVVPASPRAAALVAVRCARSDASSGPSSPTGTPHEDSTPPEDDTHERPGSIAMEGGLRFTVVRCGLIAALDVGGSDARIFDPTDVRSPAEAGAVEPAGRRADGGRPSAVALGPAAISPEDAPRQRAARFELQTEAGDDFTALVPPTPGEADAGSLVALGCDTLLGLESVTVLRLTERVALYDDQPGSRSLVVLATQAASPLSMNGWFETAQRPALELLVGAPGYAWQRVRVDVETPEHIVVLQRCGDVDVAGDCLWRGP